jgi:hypothetical protein
MQSLGSARTALANERRLVTICRMFLQGTERCRAEPRCFPKPEARSLDGFLTCCNINLNLSPNALSFATDTALMLASRELRTPAKLRHPVRDLAPPAARARSDDSRPVIEIKSLRQSSQPQVPD